jgi:tRNA G10  N-methylase Trm11
LKTKNNLNFFILGNNPTLSAAEISAVFNLNKKENYSVGNLISEDVFILEMNKIGASQIIKKIGGTIKIGVIKSEAEQNNKEKIFLETKKLFQKTGGKLKFGISYYGNKKFDVKLLAMEIKKYLRGQNISSRWISCKGKARQILSSVAVEQNKLIPLNSKQNRMEIVLIENQGQLLIGQTLAVQPFKELSFRDYSRPARDDYSGMLPPKIAQVMVNLSGAKPNDIILDPFCGSGTILTEAMLMGFQNLIGSDISKKAIDDTEKNIKWIKKNYKLKIINYKLFNKNAAGLSKFIKRNSIGAIVTEPYLGPQRGRFNIQQAIKNLEKLYAESLTEFKKILKPEGRAVMIWPVFRSGQKIQKLKINQAPFNKINSDKRCWINLKNFKIINPIPDQFRKNEIIKLTDRKTIIYGRKNQKIWREIAVME